MIRMLRLPFCITHRVRTYWQGLRHGPGPVLFILLHLGKIVLSVHLLGWALAWLWYAFAGQYLPALLHHFQALSLADQTAMLAQLDALPFPSFWSLVSHTWYFALLIVLWRLPFTLPPRRVPPSRPPLDDTDEYSLYR